MSKYTVFYVIDLTTNTTHEVLHKDSIEARAQLADKLDIDFNQTAIK